MDKLLMRSGLLVGAAMFCALLQASEALALDSSQTASEVVVRPVISTTTTAIGQPITLPQKNVQVIVSSFDVPAGAVLPVHKHPFARYGYIMAGNLQVTDVVTGKSHSYKTGDFIVEMIDEWHQGVNVGADTVKILVIDQVEEGMSNTVLRD